MSENQLLKKIQEQEILADSKLYKEIHLAKHKNERLVAELNTGYRTNSEVLAYLERITATKINASVTISRPFYTDFGCHISFGKDIFINQNVTFVDLGGITIEDQVLIGPMTRIITVNHLLDSEKRRGIEVKPVRIKKNAWIGANVTILPGVTVGKNAVIAADSTVTKDVPDNVVVAGSPAKVKKFIV